MVSIDGYQSNHKILAKSILSSNICIGKLPNTYLIAMMNTVTLRTIISKTVASDRYSSKSKAFKH